MRVLQDVREANNDQQNAVACGIASSHEDLHEGTSTSSCVVRNSKIFFRNTVSQRMDLCLEFLSTTTIHSHSRLVRAIFRLLGCNMFQPPILNMDRSLTSFGSIFVSLASKLLFIAFPTVFDFPTFPSRALRAAMFSTTSFNPSPLRSPTSSSRY